MDTRTQNVIRYATDGTGRSYGGGLADYSERDIRNALDCDLPAHARAVLLRELELTTPEWAHRDGNEERW